VDYIFDSEENKMLKTESIDVLPSGEITHNDQKHLLYYPDSFELGS